jgi:hypothetical protein
MAVRLSALRGGCPLPPGRFLALISVSVRVDPRAIGRLEGAGKIDWKMIITMPKSKVLILRMIDRVQT